MNSLPSVDLAPLPGQMSSSIHTSQLPSSLDDSLTESTISRTVDNVSHQITTTVSPTEISHYSTSSVHTTPADILSQLLTKLPGLLLPNAEPTAFHSISSTSSLIFFVHMLVVSKSATGMPNTKPVEFHLQLSADSNCTDTRTSDASVSWVLSISSVTDDDASEISPPPVY